MNYNGHKNWNHWNVSLWINNDEQLYTRARHYRRWLKADHAAQSMLKWLRANHGNSTPDGAPWTLSSVRAAMTGI